MPCFIHLIKKRGARPLSWMGSCSFHHQPSGHKTTFSHARNSLTPPTNFLWTKKEKTKKFLKPSLEMDNGRSSNSNNDSNGRSSSNGNNNSNGSSKSPFQVKTSQSYEAGPLQSNNFVPKTQQCDQILRCFARRYFLKAWGTFTFSL